MTERKAAPKRKEPPNFALVQRQVADAMRSLPRPSRYREREEYTAEREEYIAEGAENYASLWVARLCDSKPLTERQLKSKLIKIKKQSEELLFSLRTLEGSALDALWRTIADSDRVPQTRYIIPPRIMELHRLHPTPGEMMAHLQRLVIAASAPTIPEGAVKKGKGPDLNIFAREIARTAARDFNHLTGDPPTLSRNRQGFPSFLNAIFKALELRNSFADYAAEAVRWWTGPRRSEEAAEYDALVRKSAKIRPLFPTKNALNESSEVDIRRV